jgi:predicted dehydrogenase
MRTGLIGHGYWGKIISSKLKNNILSPPFDDVDWMFISTPPSTHYNLVKEYILKNKNVFCEKPLTLDYDSSLELIELARIKNIKLYIDNIFLFRDEIKNINIIPSNQIEFIWLKQGPYKNDLISDLLYHDLYLLIHLVGLNKIENINKIENTDNKLKLNFKYGNINVSIEYNREWDNKKTKLIKTEHQTIDLSFPKNDPLEESIKACFSDDILYDYNHYLSLETIKLLKLFL